jgi:hypothetical protein
MTNGCVEEVKAWGVDNADGAVATSGEAGGGFSSCCGIRKLQARKTIGKIANRIFFRIFSPRY